MSNQDNSYSPANEEIVRSLDRPDYMRPGDKCSVSLTSAAQWMSGEVFVCNEAGIGIIPKNDPPFFTPWHNVQMVTFPVADGSQ